MSERRFPAVAWRALTPVVLAGGRSRRFGSDKLLARLGDGPDDERLIDRPVGALRAVFGPRVAMAGFRDPALLDRAWCAVPDQAEDLGPLGGILAALEAFPRGIFVLAGDLPDIAPGTVEALCRHMHVGHPAAVLGRTDVVEPCIGIYLPASRPWLASAAALAAAGRRMPPLHSLIPARRRIEVAIDRGQARNVNRPEDLAVAASG